MFQSPSGDSLFSDVRVRCNTALCKRQAGRGCERSEATSPWRSRVPLSPSGILSLCGVFAGWRCKQPRRAKRVFAKQGGGSVAPRPPSKKVVFAAQ